MIRVNVRPNEPLEAALRRFKRQCNFAGIFRLAKKYNFHEKRSDKQRRERRERERAIMRAERRMRGPKMGGRNRRRTKMRVSRIKPGDTPESIAEREAAERPKVEAEAPATTEEIKDLNIGGGAATTASAQTEAGS